MIRIEGYRVGEQIYRSNKSILYKAVREADECPVVIKLLRSEYPSPEELEHFSNEFETARLLEGIRGVIVHYDLIGHHNTRAIVMEDFGGVSLDKALDLGNTELPVLIDLAIGITGILERIHKKQIIYKDIKPHNILLNPETGELKLIDFSISTKLSREVQNLVNPAGLEGTLSYISPEQTGRMNRSIDYRTDFYSLGVTLYELFTGQLPFSSKDPLELVHAHIAKVPPAPCMVTGDVPKQISDIIMKLMAKRAEGRYQSASGLKKDLERCREELETQADISPFPLAASDVPDMLRIPEKLYGREKETARLTELLNRAAEGTKQIVFLTGLSGIGKSALIQELYKPLVTRKGNFVSGKYDQFKRSVPYTALIQACSQLIRELLTESDEKVELWKKLVLEAVGSNAQVLIEVIPELELITGFQPEVQQLPAAESQNRFTMVFQNFLSLFASPEHPLVLFLDDLQWADAASLTLLKSILTTSDLEGFLLVGAYRDNEVEPGHPLQMLRDYLEKESCEQHEIKVSALTEEHISHLVSETLQTPEAGAAELAHLIQSKTLGNPFFVKEFLKALYDDYLIEFENRWQWDIEKIVERDITDNVVDLMAERIKKLPGQTREIVTLAASFGPSFPLETLSVIGEIGLERTFDDIRPAVDQGIFIKLKQTLKFSHDRVQEAAYGLLTAEEQSRLHYRIGKALLKHTPLEQREEELFAITSQLNRAGELLSGKEREELVKLNLQAGKKAKASSAYEAAVSFFSAGDRLLPRNIWETDYQLALDYYTEWAEAEYLTRSYEESKKMFNDILKNAKTILDKVKVYDMQMDYYTIQSKFQDAVRIGRLALKELQIEFPETIDETIVGSYIQQAGEVLKEKNTEQLYNLPEVKDSTFKMALKLLVKLCVPAYLTNPNFFVVIILKSLLISIEYGNEPSASPMVFATYAIILQGVLGNIPDAYDFGELAIKLADKYEVKTMQGQCYYSFNWQNHWKNPLRENIHYYKKAYQYCLDSGNFQFLDYTCNQLCFTYLLIGKNLLKLNDIYTQYTSLVRRLQQKSSLYFYGYKQTIKNLIGESNYLTEIISEDFDERKVEPEYQAVNDYTGLGNFYFTKLLLYFIFDNYSMAGKIAENQPIIEGGLLAQPLLQPYYFLYALTCSQLFLNSPDTVEKQQLLEKITTIQGQFELWAEHCPANYRHKYDLIRAELARLENKPAEEAGKLYDLAIKGAGENKFTQEEAIANELAAKYYLSKGLDKIASAYIAEARYCYIKWGCKPKVAMLEKKYARLFSSLTFTHRPSVDEGGFQVTVTSRNSSGSFSTVQLDMEAITRASQAIAGEIEMDRLLTRMLTILIESGGAQKGILILAGEDGSLLIEAVKTADSDQVSLLQSIPLDQGGWLCPAIVRYTAKTREDVVLDNAAESGLFSKDEYVKKHSLQSVLCLPVIKQDKLIALLYLENNLAPAAFTPSGVATLKMLSSQAAVSIENSRMIEQIKEKERLKKEVELAERIQTSLVPPAPVHDELEIVASMLTAEEVGGDYYDFIVDDEGKLWFAIGDVTGHGLTPGLIMMMAETSFNTVIKGSKQVSPAEAVVIVNRAIFENTRKRLKKNDFMTMHFIKYEGAGDFVYAGAHLDLLVYRQKSGNCERIKTGGIYLGMKEDIAYATDNRKFHLDTGDILLLYTDGIIETIDNATKSELFGITRLEQVLTSFRDAPIAVIMEKIKEASLAWCDSKMNDDMTIVLVKQKG